ncbi:MAG TPA: EAL domain-containing protein [Gammaproteobacteria bacterium]|nr:EAL domain-containing protein [Gammaproteobacteria bacterium]
MIKAGATTCLIVPLFIEEELTAVVALGYYQPPANPDLLLDETRGWADRIAVALSNARWQEKLYQQANYDSLTSLPNRPALKTYLQQALDRAERNDEMVGVLFIDLDRFKLVNDSLGHAAGDAYLKEISDRLSQCIRSTDMLARLSGDEFTIVLSDSPNYHHLRNSVAAVCDKLLELVPVPIDLEGHSVSSSASIGISIYPLDAANSEELMRNADSAMYHAKDSGRGCYHYFSEELNQAITEQLKIENELKVAIKEHQLELYFQPQIDASNGKLLGAETLIRWNHPTEGFIPPFRFIPIAEQTQLIVEIDLWVLNEAGAHLRMWQHQGMQDVRLAVNLSAYFFKQEGVIQLLLDLVKHHQIEPRNIELEITEGTLVEDIESAIDVLGKLKDLGFKSTIDDFGTGYSSLSYLKQLPVYKLKIDQSFVTNCATDPVDKALVQTIINMAGSLGLNCIAEGVETDEQLNSLLENGCNEIQGYYFSKPLSAENFAEKYLTTEQTAEVVPKKAMS